MKKVAIDVEKGEEDETVSPHSRLLQSPDFNLVILPVMGFATPIDVCYFKQCLEQTLIKHPRFSSILVVEDEKRSKLFWKRTTVDVDKHVFTPDLDPDMESPDEFVEDFTTRISEDPMDFTKPLWEVHVLNVKTSDANSTVIFKIHHSMGDGVSLISLVLACSKKVSDPESLPVFPSKKKTVVATPAKGLGKRMFLLVWMAILLIYYTIADTVMFALLIFCRRDTETPIKGGRGVELSRKRYVHRIINLDDVKLVKNAMKVSINDVILGVTQAGLSNYLYKKYETRIDGAELSRKTNILPKNLRITSIVVFNLRPSAAIKELAAVIENGKRLEKGKWGNIASFIPIPLRIDMHDDPLTYIHDAKAAVDRKKLTVEPALQYSIVKKIIKHFGVKAATNITTRFLNSTTLAFSNVVGPEDEILLFGHPLNYIAPTVSGFPQPLVIHYQSYANKIAICLAADEKLIPDPHQLCEDFENSLTNMKEVVIKRGLVENCEGKV